MNKNIGTLDCTLRIGGGLALIALTATDWVGPWGWIGIAPLATCLIGRCPAYTPFGIKTCTAD